MGLYEPEVDKIRRAEIREKKRAERLQKYALKKEKREKYKVLYREELAKERAKLKAEKERDIEVFKTKRAIQKAHDRARAKVKPFTPRTLFKMPSKRLTPEQKRKLKKAGVDVGKTTVLLGKSALKLLDAMYGDKKTSKRKTYKRKTYKRKPAKRKYKKKTTKRKTTKQKTAKRKGKTYYCRKCHKRHSYSSKIGRKHR